MWFEYHFPYTFRFLISCLISNMPVPMVIGCPIIIFYETPLILSCFPCVAASNKKSVVFSNDANIIVESFILSTPFLVNPMILPLQVMTSDKRLMCLGLTFTPCSFMVSVIWFTMLCFAASIPKHYSISVIWLEHDFFVSTPGVDRTLASPRPSA